jgi:gluconolactonase
MKITTLATGLGFTEGPAALRDGRIAVTSNATGRVSFLRNGAIESEVDVGGGVTGLAEDASGRLYFVQNAGFWGAPSRAGAMLGVIDSDGPRPVITAPLTAPNDLCFGPDGRLYLTDPLAAEGLEQPIAGRVYAVDVASGEAECLSDDLLFPNGIAFDADDALYVAETFRRRIVRYDVVDGRVSGPEVFAETRDGAPDGMAFDEDGGLWVAVNGADALQLFAPDGSFVRSIDLGEGAYPSNVCFQGSTAIVTIAGQGGVASFDADVRGLALHPFRDADIVIDGRSQG